MKFNYLLPVFALFFMGCCKECPKPEECKFNGHQVNRNDYEIYYKLTSKYKQTFQFQACDKIFYSTVGKFDGELIEEEEKFQLNGIEDMKILLLMSNNEFTNKRLDIEEVIVDYKHPDTIKFMYKIIVKSQNDAVSKIKFIGTDDDKQPFPLILNNNANIEFVASSKDVVMAASCFTNEFDGGGYECNGRGTF